MNFDRKAMVLKEFCGIDTAGGASGKSLPLRKAPLDPVDLPVPVPGLKQGCMHGAGVLRIS